MAGLQELAGSASGDSEEAHEILFKPPLYIQRYTSVTDVLEQYHHEKCSSSSSNNSKFNNSYYNTKNSYSNDNNHHGENIQQLLDVGCAECKFLKRAIQLPFLKSIYGLDIDRELLKQKSVVLEPLITDHLHKREHDLHVKVFAGDISDHDPIMLNVDVVTAIEVIEHLHEPVLDAFVITVFSYIRPKLVVITTPNSEFNVLFSNFSGMRHWDHKFEWTREQFQNWCNCVSKKYNYKVTFSGVGDPPVESSALGHCSQMAVFTLTADVARSPAGSDKYEQIFSTVYPGINMTDTEIINNEIEYTVNTQSFIYIQENAVTDLSHTMLPLDVLLSSNATLRAQLDISALADRLEILNYTISEDRQFLVIDMQDPASSLSADDDDWISDSWQKDTPVADVIDTELCWD